MTLILDDKTIQELTVTALTYKKEAGKYEGHHKRARDKGNYSKASTHLDTVQACAGIIESIERHALTLDPVNAGDDAALSLIASIREEINQLHADTLDAYKSHLTKQTGNVAKWHRANL